MAIFLISIFTVGLKWLPSIGFVSFSESPSGWLKSLILPSCSLALGTSAIVIRYVTASLDWIFSSLLNFFNDTATTEIYTLSLHDALPI